MSTKLTYGIIAVLLLGSIGGGLILLTPEQLDAAYTCNVTNVTGIFERFSSTYKTAYWTENTVNKQIVCTNGKWIPTREWMKIYNVTDAQMTGLPLTESNIDELGNPIINGTTIIVDKSGKVNIAGVVYDIDCPGCKYKVKCICEKGICATKECAS